jgi:DNA invertase Pin-like site-specific DNA recombinase
VGRVYNSTSVTGQRIGYVRVSTLDRNEKRQLEGQVPDRVFTDKASGRDTTTRPELTELLRFARDGGHRRSCTVWTGSAGTSR